MLQFFFCFNDTEMDFVEMGMSLCYDTDQDLKISCQKVDGWMDGCLDA